MGGQEASDPIHLAQPSPSAPGNWSTHSQPAGNGEPDWIFFGAQQGADSEHAVGTGSPCYRIVFKTLRVAVRPAELKWPNMLVRFGVGPVKRGGALVVGALPLREPNRLLLPEFGELVETDGSLRYEPTSRTDPQFKGWEDETQPLCFVEVLLDIPDVEKMSDVIALGRRRSSSIITILELSFGRRLLGPVLCEEVSERFEDGHLTRHIATDLVGWEPQLNVTGIDHSAVQNWSTDLMSNWMSRPAEDQRRFSLASQWYQLGMTTADWIMSFLNFWFVAEVLAMPNGTHVRQVCDRIKAIADSTEFEDSIRRLYGLRGDLVHGKAAEVTAAQLASARCIAQLLLVTELGLAPDDSIEALRSHTT